MSMTLCVGDIHTLVTSFVGDIPYSEVFPCFFIPAFDLTE